MRELNEEIAMGEPVSAIAGIFEIITTLKKWAGELRAGPEKGQNKRYEKLALLIETKVLELERDVKKLANENESLRAQADLKSKMEFRDGVYYLTEDVPGCSRGPFCPTCWEDRQEVITLQGASFLCPICQRCLRPRPCPPRVQGGSIRTRY